MLQWKRDIQHNAKGLAKQNMMAIKRFVQYCGSSPVHFTIARTWNIVR